MRAFAVAIALTLCFSGFSLAKPRSLGRRPHRPRASCRSPVPPSFAVARFHPNFERGRRSACGLQKKPAELRRNPSCRGVIVRPLVPGDRAQWQPLWEGYLEFYRASVAPEVHDVTFARLTGGLEPMGGFVATDGEDAVGIVHWITHRSCWTIGDYCYLQDLFVAPGRRGGGHRALPHRGGVCEGALARLLAGVLAHPRDECHRDAAL